MVGSFRKVAAEPSALTVELSTSFGLGRTAKNRSRVNPSADTPLSRAVQQRRVERHDAVAVRSVSAPASELKHIALRIIAFLKSGRVRNPIRVLQLLRLAPTRLLVLRGRKIVDG